MTKKIIIITLLMAIVTLTMSCNTADILTGNAVPNKEWELIEESAMTSTINLYVTSQDEGMRAWLSTKFYKTLKDSYKMDVVVRILAFDDIITTLETEVLNEVTDGSMDLLILKDDEFTILAERGYLYEDIATKIPNLESNINRLDIDVATEHGTPLGGYGIPFAREQFVFAFDEDELEIYPKNTEELLKFLEENPKMFTYANPMKNATGAEFLRTVVYEIIGEEKMLPLMTENYTEAEVEALIMPAIEYLKEIDPYLLKNDGAYYVRQEEIDALFKEGLLYFSMTQDFGYVEDAVNNEDYPDGARSFMFEKGTIGDTSYLVVPMNASNKTGALVAINEAISLELQLNKYIPSNWGSLPILDLDLMSESDAERFSRASVKRNTLTVEELFMGRYPELPMDVQDMINAIWDRHINMQ